MRMLNPALKDRVIVFVHSGMDHTLYMLPKMITISYIIRRYVRFPENNRFITSSIGYVKIGITLSIHYSMSFS